MSHGLQSVLLEDLEISLPGFALRRLALNQHMPKVERLDEHLHGFHQCLLYLRGSGRQQIGGREVAVRRGTLLVIPPGVPHRFVKEGEVRPLCLAIDFAADSAAETWAELSHLPAPALAKVEETLVALHTAEAAPLRSVLRIGALLLDLMALIEERATARERAAPPDLQGLSGAGPVSAAVRRFVARHGFGDLSPGAVARQLGRSLDHLNRQMRRESGMTVGEALSQARLARARELLDREELAIAEVAAAVGMADQNYFARWFRKQTGESPRRWRERAAERSAPAGEPLKARGSRADDGRPPRPGGRPPRG